MIDALQLVRGSWRDYDELATHHYRAGRPATVVRVLALRHERPSVVGRYLGRRGERRTVGVLVESMPTLDCRARDLALGGRYRAWRQRRARARVLNAEMRCISRVIVHPQWRGLGLAVRLVRAALDSATTVYTEAVAAMGAVHPFFERAGMTAYRRPPHQHDDRLAAALTHLGIEPVQLARLDDVCARIAALDDAQRRWFERELARWHRHTHHRRGAGAPTALRERLESARHHLVCEPTYYLWSTDHAATHDDSA